VLSALGSGSQRRDAGLEEDAGQEMGEEGPNPSTPREGYTVAIPFTRSMRALHADDHLSTLVGLSVALVLLAAWAAWFFLARIGLNATGQIVATTREGAIIAAFPAAAQGSIRRGQRARLLPKNGNGAEPNRPLAAIVTAVAPQAREDQLQVELYVLEDATARRVPQSGLRGDVEIAVAHVTPATLVMRRWTMP
jgi:hypothetical protein